MVDPYTPIILLVLGIQLKMMYQLGRIESRLKRLESTKRPVECRV